MYTPKGTTLRGIVVIRTLSLSAFCVCMYVYIYVWTHTFWELLDSSLCVLQITGSVESVI